MTIDEIMRTSPVIPVLVLDGEEDWAKLAETFVGAGLTVLEVTLRTPVALDAIRAMAKVPGAIVGAGTVLNERAARRGARCGQPVHRVARPHRTRSRKPSRSPAVAYLPGVATAGDIMRGLDLGLDRFKFFPAEASGGIAALKAHVGALRQVRFCPTGGIRPTMPPSGSAWSPCSASAAAGSIAAQRTVWRPSPSAPAPLPRYASKFRINHSGVISCVSAQRRWRSCVNIRLGPNGTMAGVAVAWSSPVGVIRRCSAAERQRRPTDGAGREARQAKLTVDCRAYADSDLRRADRARSSDRRDRCRSRRPRSWGEECFRTSRRKGIDARARPRASRRPREARPRQRGDDSRRRPLSDARRPGGIARRLDAAMFVSLHIDSAPNPLARGASVYSLSDVASDAEAARLAALGKWRRHARRGSGGSVEAMLSDLAMRSQMSASADLAVAAGEQIGRAGSSFGRTRIASPLSTSFRRAGTPAVLFEAGYLSNADDEVLLR